jgi:hypothetical protein
MCALILGHPISNLNEGTAFFNDYADLLYFLSSTTLQNCNYLLSRGIFIYE